jgi:hypothetical protein
MIFCHNLMPLILCLSVFVQLQSGRRLERDIIPEEFIKSRPVKSSAARRKRVRYRRVKAGTEGKSQTSSTTQLGLTVWRLRRATAAEVGERIVVQEEGEAVE